MQELFGHLRIVVLLHQSLLAWGIACRLMEYGEAARVRIVDSEAPDIERIMKELAPEAIIMDASDTGICEKPTFTKLFEWLPETKIICLDQTSNMAHVITSQEVPVASTRELLNILQTPGV